MKKFDVSAYGVEEIGCHDARQVNGGLISFIGSMVAAYYIGKYLYKSLEGAYNAGYNAGYNDGRNV